VADDIKGQPGGSEPGPAGSQGTRPEGGPSVPPLPSLVRNRISVVGALIAVVTLANIFLLFLVMLETRPNPYFGIFVYLLFPGVALFGLLLIPIGMFYERRRRRRLLGQPGAYRQFEITTNTVLTILGFAFIFITATAAASYYSYQFTESDSFCGQTCHEPMKPQWTAYQHSPHARVDCVDCHVGQGATYFLRAKLAGLNQLNAVMRSDYPRPITDPISNMRPVRAACEQCHWPEKFYGVDYKVFPHTALDEKNSDRTIRMLINTGGGSAEFGQHAGIHWHMNLANTVTFVASDKQEQVIPWVRMKSADGTVVDYLDKTSSITPKQIQESPKQTMDCVTCHSRPAHRFRAPTVAVDHAFEAGALDRDLPSLKQQAVKLLSKHYESEDKAVEDIATTLDGFYRTKYPAIYTANLPQIKAAITTLQSIFENNFFLFMKVDWRTYPDNIGHLNYPGCFRCHDGNHVSADGRVLSNDCETCHIILAPAEASAKPSAGNAAASKAQAASPPPQTIKDGATPSSEQGWLTLAHVKFQHPTALEHMNNCDSCHKGARL